ncbi:bifunctional GNAT family N-acetyltransferase/carbon-nitrogen hydrolase family protein [Desulforhopalus sp. IMCC35007]|uniref:bifunctional GNAT family N-acetyltransferase/carbon-nitrogen hydrolase family protein n=1 Tax=Desulforhopalus sp. IMCC35007 TaxID=2569543 RepID=UPI0010ADC2F3|nr:bifunctional GNAT family N-acetyltransferase/carbon-nitrogen hydrolase family protein [Desulforhopalus sp. IMCC35007]TKB07568.1 GNAT family N-acetyltransferase [Desulforhopalus sp. IMCC35007]
MTTEIEHKLQVRNLTLDDYETVRDMSLRVYKSVANLQWPEKTFRLLIETFPEGQVCIEDHGKPVAVAFSLTIDYSLFGDSHSYSQITADGNYTTHDPEGDYLYGIEVIVDPEYQGMRLGRRLYDTRKELAKNLNLKGILIGGRIPGYHKYSEEISPEEYIIKVKQREIYDPVLTFQMSNDFHVLNILDDYWPDDHHSRGNAVLLEWINIYYRKRTKLIGRTQSIARIGVVQWQMRRFDSFEDFLQQVEFFVDTVSDYKADIVLFPELFNAPLIHTYEGNNPMEAMRMLASHTENLRLAMIEMALSYNINIITGSVPELRDDGNLYNVSYLCRRDGTWDYQSKLHITPDEDSHWGFSGGHDLKVFDTDVGKIGILICYDVEFPELARIQAEKGMKMLFVPFWTDTKTGYLRVRRCAQARAIENECFVAISGSVGNIPKVETMGIQYSQAAVFTPSDFSFPHDAIASEATPGIETTLINDLDLDLIKELRQKGSVRNAKSRRNDLYELRWKGNK